MGQGRKGLKWKKCDGTEGISLQRKRNGNGKRKKGFEMEEK